MGRRSRRVLRGMEDFLENVMKELALNTNHNLVEGTPRLTGWAETNWIASISKPNQGVSGSHKEARAGSLDLAPMQVGFVKIAGYKLKQGRIHITNNVYYLLDLNAGTSKKAPAMFVEMAIDKSIRTTIR